MNIEDRISLAKQLIQKREEIERQLAELFGGGSPRRQKCSICGSPDHSARSCPQRSRAASEPPTSASPISSTPFSMLSSLTQQDDGAADL